MAARRLTGADIEVLDDARLAAAIATTTVFARVSPEDKARIVRVQRLSVGGVAFLGDGVNDALALHAADVGISVDSATDVAKDAADVILLEKDLDVLADGVAEGRRIFANTIKYVLMGTSSNFGNMASAAGASLFLSFLPMLPSQILLNNLLYDTSQLAIPTDNVDAEQLRRQAAGSAVSRRERGRRRTGSLSCSVAARQQNLLDPGGAVTDRLVGLGAVFQRPGLHCRGSEDAALEERT